MWRFHVEAARRFAEPHLTGNSLASGRRKSIVHPASCGLRRSAAFAPQGLGFMQEDEVRHVDVSITLPPAWCSLILSGEWKTFLVPHWLVASVADTVFATASRRALFNVNIFDEMFGLRVPRPLPAGDRMASIFSQTAALESFLISLSGRIPPDKELELQSWVRSIRGLEDERQQRLAVESTRARPIAEFLAFVSLASKLRNMKGCKAAVENACDIVLPRVFDKATVEYVRTAALSSAHGWDDIAAARFLIDCAYMAYMREVNKSQRFLRYLQLDSSPQAGRDYLNIITCSVDKKALPRMLFESWRMQRQAADGLRYFFEAPGVVSESAVEAHTAAQKFLREHLVLHRCPTVLIGMGRASLGHKAQALAHALRLEQETMADLSVHVSEFHSFAPDFGVESLFGHLQPISAQELLPYWERPGRLPRVEVEQERHANDFSEVEAEVEQGPDLGVELDFSTMMLNPGHAHIVNNAANNLQRSMSLYEKKAQEMKAVCDLVRSRRHRPRLQASCFADPRWEIAVARCLYRLRCSSPRAAVLNHCICRTAVEKG